MTTLLYHKYSNNLLSCIVKVQDQEIYSLLRVLHFSCPYHTAIIFNCRFHKFTHFTSFDNFYNKFVTIMSDPSNPGAGRSRGRARGGPLSSDDIRAILHSRRRPGESSDDQDQSGLGRGRARGVIKDTPSVPSSGRAYHRLNLNLFHFVEGILIKSLATDSKFTDPPTCLSDRLTR